MPGFTQVFGGTTIAPANATFLSLVMSADVTLAWPIEQAVNGNVVADTIEVSATAPGLNIDFPDARQVSTGYTTCFNNTGAETVTVRDAAGATILSLVSGTAWVIYLADNSTLGGTWRVFQLGASVSVAVAAALAGAGLRAIGATLNQDIPITSFAVTPTTLTDSDRAKLMNWTGGLGTLNLPSAPAVGNGWFVQVRNTGSGDLTVTPPSGVIDEAVNKTFAAGTSAVIVTDGTDYFTLGFGSSAAGAGGFDFVEIDVAGSGNFVLSGVNLNRVAYRFIGVLTGDRTIIVPNAIQQYWVDNSTTGSFSLFVKTATQAAPGVEILQDDRNILYCDGSDVLDAESSTVTFPIPVAQGGTGATTAAGARTNLGAGATGSDIFVAGSQAAAQTALGIALASTNDWTAAGTLADPTVQYSSSRPVVALFETDAAADNGLWTIEAQGEQFIFRASNDAGSGSTAWLTVDRTGTTIDTVNFANGTLQYGGVEVGFKGMPRRDFAASDNTVAADNGKALRFTGAGGQTFTADGDLATDGNFILLNDGSASLTVAGSASLSWFNGSGTIPTGNRTLAVGGIMTLYHTGSGNYLAWGSGLS
jgi:hypothetical protein